MGLALFAAVGLGCASMTPDAAAVKVYQADLKTEGSPAPPLPQGCRFVGSGGPIEQQEQERHTSDPYRVQRNATASSGGNVLLVRSYRFMTLKRTDCAESQAGDCTADSAQNWYRVSFAYYACDASAQAALAELKPKSEGGLFVWTFKKNEPAVAAPAVASAPAPSGQPATAPASAVAVAAPAPSESAAALKAKVLALVQEGVGDDVIAAYVRSRRPTPPLGAEEILDWKKAGISDAVIRATFAN